MPLCGRSKGPAALCLHDHLPLSLKYILPPPHRQETRAVLYGQRHSWSIFCMVKSEICSACSRSPSILRRCLAILSVNFTSDPYCNAPPGSTLAVMRDQPPLKRSCGSSAQAYTTRADVASISSTTRRLDKTPSQVPKKAFTSGGRSPLAASCALLGGRKGGRRGGPAHDHHAEDDTEDPHRSASVLMVMSRVLRMFFSLSTPPPPCTVLFLLRSQPLL